MSRLGNVWKDEVKEVMKIEKSIKRRLPVKGLIGTMVTLGLVFVTLMTIVALSIGGSVSIDKEKMGVNAGATFHISLPMENITEVVDIVLPTVSSDHPRIGDSSTTTSTSSTTTTLKEVRIYGAMHGSTTAWKDPITGVGSVPSGNDKGVCGG